MNDGILTVRGGVFGLLTAFSNHASLKIKGVKVKEKEIQAIAALNQWGVPYLSTPFTPTMGFSLELSDLLTRLIQSDSTRLKLGVTAFFLVHSEKASAVLDALPLLEEGQRQMLRYLYTAAVYLQRLWRRQLAHFGNGLLPDYFSQELGLPEPVLLHGRLGLGALEEALQGHIHEPYNYKASFDALIRLLLEEEKFCERACQS
ncbi:MAG: hypothetical protein HY877_07975 [Deltaproteobacteria bacterium]|nr:hypothetical protein [Deltaproteobacteria bacterium]